MRIAMLVRAFSKNGGLELYTYHLVNGLLERGHSVVVVCEEDDTGLVHPQLTVQKFAPSPPGSRKSARLLHYLEASSAAIKAAGNFDIIHSQHLPSTLANVVTFHNHTASRLVQVGYGWERLLTKAKLALVKAYRLRDHFDHMLCVSAKCLIFPSKICMEDFSNIYSISKNNPSAICAVAYPGATIGETAQVSEIARPDGEFNFLFVGKGFRKKGLDVLLQACEILKSRGKRCHLLIAGLKRKPIDAARLMLMGLSDRVSYLGFCQDMQAVYARASAIVLPSRIEPFGMAPLQGAAAGLVPIVSKMCGAAEVLHDGVDSLILQNHLDANDLANQMQRLIDDPEMASKLAVAARSCAEAVTWDRTVLATIDAYNAALSNVKS
jgi:glycosyltransferase involved in cell wall biosynthesis